MSVPFVNAIVIRRNCCYCADGNPIMFHELHTLNPQKLNVWSGIWSLLVLSSSWKFDRCHVQRTATYYHWSDFNYFHSGKSCMLWRETDLLSPQYSPNVLIFEWNIILFYIRMCPTVWFVMVQWLSLLIVYTLTNIYSRSVHKILEKLTSSPQNSTASCRRLR